MLWYVQYFPVYCSGVIVMLVIIVQEQQKLVERIALKYEARKGSLIILRQFRIQSSFLASDNFRSSRSPINIKIKAEQVEIQL